jgi:hypothetical protein
VRDPGRQHTLAYLLQEPCDSLGKALNDICLKDIPVKGREEQSLTVLGTSYLKLAHPVIIYCMKTEKGKRLSWDHFV